MSSQPWRSTQTPSLRSLLLLFVAWKAILWMISYGSPGVGYDTSSDLLAYREDDQFTVQDVPTKISHSVFKFVRWDAIYYTEMARQGHVYEQEWAFGKGLSTVLAYVTQLLGLTSVGNKGYAIAGILVSHVAHMLSVVVIFFTVRLLRDPAQRGPDQIAVIASILHVISPAGIFLSSPYSESLFSFWNMLGCYLYIQHAYHFVEHKIASGAICTLFAGVAFGLAASIRGNGILSGIPFFIDAIENTLRIANPCTDTFQRSRLFVQLLTTILAGCFVATGLFYPQYLAYREYCMEGPGDRPWCQARLPSIFTFVQSHYWNVGFLRYWTLSNLPLFLLAAPCLGILTVSGWQGVVPALSSNPTLVQKLHLRMALPQLTLAILALTSYHVQIITRLSSGYPFWYMWLATKSVDQKYATIMIRVMIMYGLIQAGLYASFLPPA